MHPALDRGDDAIGVSGPEEGFGIGIGLDEEAFYGGLEIDTGEVAVEAPAIGDDVITFSGAVRPVKWIGRRSYDGRFVAGNPSVLPICIAASALADAMPARDLWVSPEHALYIDELLVPARLLVNGATIRQSERVERVEYFHIELDSHDKDSKEPKGGGSRAPRSRSRAITKWPWRMKRSSGNASIQGTQPSCGG